MYKCAEIVYTHKYNIKINFISVRYIYGDSPSKNDERAIKKKLPVLQKLKIVWLKL